MIRQCFLRLSSISLPYTLFAVVFSLLIAVGAHPVVAADGDLDTSFGTGGKVVTSFLGQDDFVRSVAIQSDGKIVVAGETKNGTYDEFALARYNPDGTLDTSFGNSGGKMITNSNNNGDHARSVAIQSDGKIVLAGAGDNTGNDDFALYRYNTDGSLDSSFGTGGKVFTAVGSGNDFAESVAIQSDGKIVVAGYSYNGSNDDFALVRYNTDGSLDTSFDSDGKVTTDVGSGSDVANSVAIQSDGKIVAAGNSKNGNYRDFALVRYAGTPPAPPPPVPTLPLFGLGILVSLLGLFGLRKLRQ